MRREPKGRVPLAPRRRQRESAAPKVELAGAYRMPAEWDLHRATWIAWPHERRDWPGKMEPIPWVYAEIVRHLTRSETVSILVQDRAAIAAARKVLAACEVNLAQVSFHVVPTDRAWVRDTAPLIVRGGDGERIAVCFKFNGWAKYVNCRRDAKVGRAIATVLSLPQVEPEQKGRRIVLEGGAIDVDGEGTLLATEECLLSRVQARNPGLGRRGTEDALAEALGVTKVIWLGRGIAGDDTHGHIDDLARFVGPGRVLLAQEPDGGDANHRPLAECWERLQGATDAKGRRLEVVALPMPAPRRFCGQRLPASYANFYIANRVVLVPTFNDPNDRRALGLLGELFPDRSVIGIHAVDLVWGLGTLHCMTMQEPAE